MATVNSVVLPIPQYAETGVSLNVKEMSDFRAENTETMEHVGEMICKVEKELYLQTVLEEVPIPEKSSTPEKEVKEEKKDSAALSFESRSLYLDAEVLRAKLNEQFALLERILQELMNCTPSVDKTILQDIKELSLLYQRFYEQVFMPVCENERTVLLQKLYRQLSDCADILLRMHLPEITSFLKTYNMPAAKDNLTFAVFYLMTGKRGLETEIKNFALNASFAKPGVPYGKDGQRSAVFSSSAFNEEQTDSKDFGATNLRGRGNSEGFLVEVRGMSKKEIIQILPKLEQVEGFIKYLNSGGNLYKAPEFTAKNEEFLGFLMAETAIKTQIFSANVKLPTPVESSLRNAVQKLIDFHIQIGNTRDIYRVYMHTMHLFQTSKNPKLSLEKGLKYALEQFFAKRDDNSVSLNSSYNKESGFFQIKESERSSQAMLAENIRLLEKDWKKFLKTLERKGNYALYEAFSNYSPWGSALAPEPPKAEHSLIQFSVLKAITVAVVLVAAYLLFYK